MTRENDIRKSVLIVDDDKGICEILREYCLNMGCFKHIVLAHDGAMASTKLKNQKFDLILLDINMPKKSGLDLLEEMSTCKLNEKENVMIVSGSLDKDTVNDILKFGSRIFLVKPFDEDLFRDRILKTLKGKLSFRQHGFIWNY